jgi:hypothetical protein
MISSFAFITAAGLPEKMKLIEAKQVSEEPPASKTSMDGDASQALSM